MKILLISPYWKEEHRWMVSSVKLAELWGRLGHEVVAICMGSETSTEKISDSLTVHYRKDVYIPDPWNTGIAPTFFFHVRRLIKSEKPDIIIANKILFWSTFPTVPLLWLCGHKIVVITDALVGMTWWPRNRIPKIVAFFAAWTAGWLTLLCAKKVVFFHPQPESLLKKLGIHKKSTVIPTGIESSKYSYDKSQENKNPKSKIQIPTEEIVISYIGRLESVKGVDDFLAAAVPLKKENPNMNIQVIGWFLEGNVLVEEYQREVAFTGLRDDIPAILSKTDIFVLPSYSEGLSNALMEAMSSGCACIATQVGGNQFLIQNGISGFLYPPGDIEVLRSHIQKLIEDPFKRKSLGEEARKRIEEKFDWKVVGELYQNLFKSL